MKNIQKFFIIPLVALLIGLLPQNLVFARENPWVDTSGTEDYKYYVYGRVESDSSNGAISVTIHKYFFNDGEIVSFGGTPNSALLCSSGYFYSTQYTVFSDGSTSEPTINKYTDTEFYVPVYQINNIFGGSRGTYYSNYQLFYDVLNEVMPDDVPMSPDDNEDNRVDEMPSEGNGIYIISPSNNSKINKLKYNDKGYFEQNYTVKVQYKPDDSGFFPSTSSSDKSKIIKSFTSEMEDSDFAYQIFSDSFSWVVTPEKALDSVSSPYAIAEFQLNTVFKDLGKKRLIVNCELDVLSGSPDFSLTREYRKYSDSIVIEFFSDENYSDGSIINPDGSVGSGDNGLDFDNNLEGFPTSPGDGASIVDWIKYFGDVILWLITYPFKLLANAFVVLGGYITTMVNTLTDTSKQITGLFTFIPSDILNVTYGFISFTLLYSVVRGVLKLIRGN